MERSVFGGCLIGQAIAAAQETVPAGFDVHMVQCNFQAPGDPRRPIAYGVERAPFLGWSMGVNTMFEVAVTHPERVTGLFAVGGVPGDTFSSMLAPVFLPRPLRKPLTVGAARLMKLAGKPLDGPLPQPALWYEDDDNAEDEADAAEPQAVLIIQAEVHETDTGALEVLGLMLPDGATKVGFSDDVDVVEGDDAFWSGLVEEALFGGPA